MLYCEKGGEQLVLTEEDLRRALTETLQRLGKKRKVLALPPDITRYHSRAGILTCFARDFYGPALTDIMPALGTHAPMTAGELNTMFPGIPHSLFREHRWRSSLTTLGEVPASYVSMVSEGRLNYSWPAQVNRLLTDGGFDLILSLGQVVPHEVVGMANHSKNIFVGTGGSEGIHKSHFLGAVYGMERIMGRTDTPVRAVLDYAREHFAGHLPILYVLTVVSPDRQGKPAVRGLFIGDGRECFEKAALLARRVNLTMVEKPLKKCVVYLNPQEFRSTWLGNKAVYRTRMAMADGGELIVLAPGIKEFGEDRQIDTLIRRYGYRGTPAVLEAVQQNADLGANLSAAAHLIHGSSEGRFSITCAPGKLSRKEIEAAGFQWADVKKLQRLYTPEKRQTGWNSVNGEEFFFVSNPALGLWAHESRFKQGGSGRDGARAGGA